jgi:hypothetical protein
VTPEERAEKIALHLGLPDGQRRYVLAQIREVISEWSAIVIPQAKAYAFLDAAKIVEAFQPLRGLRPDIEKHDEGMREMLASNIRVRAKEVSGG